MIKQVLWVVSGAGLAGVVNLLAFTSVQALGFFGPEVVAVATQTPFSGKPVVLASVVAVLGAALTRAVLGPLAEAWSRPLGFPSGRA